MTNLRGFMESGRETQLYLRRRAMSISRKLACKGWPSFQTHAGRALSSSRRGRPLPSKAIEGSAPAKWLANQAAPLQFWIFEP